jgi:hypothetical protein
MPKALDPKTRSAPVARRPGLVRLIGAVLVVYALGTAPGTALAEEPLRLALVRDAADLRSVEGSAGCVRGRLYVVRSFDAGARRVWVGDVLEITSAEAGAIAPGPRDGLVRPDREDGWRLELPDANAVLASAPGGSAEAATHRVLLGRRPDGSRPAACRTQVELLEEREAIVERLRRLAISPSGSRAVEVRVSP